MNNAAAPTIAPTANIAMNIGKPHIQLFSGIGVGVGVGNGVGVGVGVGVGSTGTIRVNMPESPDGFTLIVAWLPDASTMTFCI